MSYKEFFNEVVGKRIYKISWMETDIDDFYFIPTELMYNNTMGGNLYSGDGICVGYRAVGIGFEFGTWGIVNSFENDDEMLKFFKQIDGCILRLRNGGYFVPFKIDLVNKAICGRAYNSDTYPFKENKNYEEMSIEFAIIKNEIPQKNYNSPKEKIR